MHERSLRCFAEGCWRARWPWGLWASGAGAHNHDRDRAERLQALGEVRPLQAILAQVARDYPGQILKVEFEQAGEQRKGEGQACRGRWFYELKLLQDQGRLTKLRIDARTGETLWVVHAIDAPRWESPMRLLVVEDEPLLAAQLKAALEKAGYAVDVAADGLEAEHQGRHEPCDLAVLDLGLPGRDGLSALGAWRAAGRSMPVLILTARDNWHDKVAGIDAGADDYLSKPFHQEELEARVRALLRRAGGHATADIRCGPLLLDTRQSRILLDEAPLELTSHEYRVLAYLLMHQDEAVSRSQLVEHIYAQDFDRDSNTIEVFVARLRRKIPPGLIQTVRGLGYRLSAGPP